MGVSSLTKSAERISALIEALPEAEAARVAGVVVGVVTAGRGLASLDPVISSELQSLLLGFVMKNQVFGPEKPWMLIRAGCSPRILALIAEMEAL